MKVSSRLQTAMKRAAAKVEAKVFGKPLVDAGGILVPDTAQKAIEKLQYREWEERYIRNVCGQPADSIRDNKTFRTEMQAYPAPPSDRADALAALHREGAISTERMCQELGIDTVATRELLAKEKRLNNLRVAAIPRIKEVIEKRGSDWFMRGDVIRILGVSTRVANEILQAAAHSVGKTGPYIEREGRWWHKRALFGGTPLKPLPPPKNVFGRRWKSSQ